MWASHLFLLPVCLRSLSVCACFFESEEREMTSAVGCRIFLVFPNCSLSYRATYERLMTDRSVAGGYEIR